ncbi:MAG: AAA family ATPase [Bacteroidetes bacterium]|nr:AAA family ATPase [Bacteroidota bacterium]
MEILYLYIKDHPILKNCNLNFGGKYRLEYSINDQTLNVLENPYYFPNFFMHGGLKDDQAEIKNITALVGNNGSGKTTLLDFIVENFATSTGGVKYSIIALYRKAGSKYILYHSDDLPIKKGNFKTFDFTIEILRNEYETRDNKSIGGTSRYTIYPRIDDFNEVSMIFFSNVFDGRGENEFAGIHNISTNYLVRADFRRNIEFRILSKSDGHRELDSFTFGEVERQIAFLNSNTNNVELPFNIPNSLTISIRNNLTNFDQAFDASINNPIREYDIQDFYLNAAKIFRKKIEGSKKAHIKAKNYFIANAVLNFVYELVNSYVQIQSEFSFKFDSRSLDEKLDAKALAIRIIKDIEKQTAQRYEEGIQGQKVRIEFSQTNELARNTLLFFDELEHIIDPKQVDFSSGTSFSIDIRNKERFRQFHELYLKTFLFRPYLNFNWRNLSSGQKAFLNLYSRFYSLSDQILKGDKLKQHLIIMIDEGDIYLHPEWQKKFLSLVIDFVSRIFVLTPEGKRRTIQFFITTNSPIAISDLPNSNVIFLFNKDNITHIKDSLDDKKQTFGANIHTLFADSFFLNQGTIGDFAMAKINYLINLLQGDIRGIEDNKDEIQKTILMVGEPVIKSKLLQMLNDRLSLNLVQLNSRVTQLENDIHNLKKGS